MIHDVHICANIRIVREIRFYSTQSGEKPVEQFLDSLDGKQAQMDLQRKHKKHRLLKYILLSSENTTLKKEGGGFTRSLDT